MSLSKRDFVAGWGAGICGLLVGHPADTIKVRQQVSMQSNIVKILVSTLKTEGINGLYRGMSFPLLLAGVQNSVFFGVYGNTLRTFQNKQNADINLRSCGEGSTPNKYWHLNVYMAGCTAGLVHTFIACPVDIIKVKIQAQKSADDIGSHRVKQCIKSIYSNSGFLGFYRGFIATLFRDVPSYGFYVLLYEHLLSFGCSENDKRCQFSVTAQLLAGGLAGTITWVSVTPFDVVKSRIQADNIRNPQYHGMINCFIKSYNENGLSVFGRGFWVHVLRGFPVNAATFAGYEWCYKTCTFVE